jgi:hypothetical protein
MKIEIFKNKKKFKKGGFHTNPNIGWEIILVVAAVLTIASISLGVYLFLDTNKKFTTYELDGSSAIKIVKKDRIEKVLEYFAVREQRSRDILNSPSPIIDPSI